jgi:Holliday junction resolvasome RuvABC DNA-binding subunit
MAEKIILELKDKDFVKNPNIELKEEIKENKIEKNLKQDIITTLSNMGYSKSDIEKALDNVNSELKTIEEIIPEVIRNI